MQIMQYRCGEEAGGKSFYIFISHIWTMLSSNTKHIHFGTEISIIDYRTTRLPAIF